jgi:DNA protecting protein DprA
MDRQATSERKSSARWNDDGLALLRSPRGLLALQTLPRIGRVRTLRLALFTTNYDAWLEEAGRQWPKALDTADRLLDECVQHDISVLGLFDENYPERLRALHDPPLLLFVHGSVGALNEEKLVAVVGTREPTKFGCSATEDITALLAEHAWGVVSGLAKGIDTLAHGAALKHHTLTIAVLAGGLDRVYPKENTELADAIVDQGGAIVAEVPPGARPQKSSFVARNRLQTGLSAAVVATQTGVKGGTMHTARHAAGQGRPLFCPKPHSRHEKSEGLNLLLTAPARDLWRLVPAFGRDRKMCERLGDHPLACPVTREDVDAFIERLDHALDDPRTTPAPRNWPPTHPPEAGDDLAPDHEEAPLFAAFE